MPVEDIILKLILQDEASSKLAKTQGILNKWQFDLNSQIKKSQVLFQRQQENLRLLANGKQLRQVIDQFDSLGGSLKMPFSIWQKVNKVGGKFNTTGGKTGNILRLVTHGMKGFRMEMLSLLFGGQQLKKTMFGLIQPALEMVGAFEILTATLQIMFLPIAMILLEYFFLPLLNVVSSLPEWFKVIIGVVVVLVGLFAALIAIIAGLILFVGSLILVLSILAFVAFVLEISVAALIGWVLLIIFAIILLAVAIYLLWDNWSQLWDWIVTKVEDAWTWIVDNIWKPIKDFFTTWVINPLTTAWNLFNTWVIQPIKQAWTWIVDNVWKPVAAWFDKWVVQPLKIAYNWIKDNIWTPLGDSFKSNVIDPIKKHFSDLLLWLAEKWEAIKVKLGFAPGIISNLKTVDEAAKNFVPGTPKLDFPTSNSNKKGVLQTGGYVPYDGLYKLHQGENVSQSNTNNFSPNITINASSNVDIETVKRQLSSQWSDELARLSRG